MNFPFVIYCLESKMARTVHSIEYLMANLF